MSNVVGDRFQITIEKKVRDQLGIQPGDRAVEWVEDGHLVVDFLRPHSESMLGVVKELSDVAIEPITDWQAVKERAWAARSAEITDSLRTDSERHRATENQR